MQLFVIVCDDDMKPIILISGNTDKRGVEFSGPVLDDTALRLAYFADPDGNPFYLAEMKPAYR